MAVTGSRFAATALLLLATLMRDCMAVRFASPNALADLDADVDPSSAAESRAEVVQGGDLLEDTEEDADEEDAEDAESDAEVDVVMEGKMRKAPRLCSRSIVQEECEVLNLIGNPKKVSVDELCEAMSVTRKSAIEFFTAIGLMTSKKEEWSCKRVCRKVVAAIPEAERPPSSDVACRKGIKRIGEPKVVCDVDVTPEELAQVEFDTDSHDFHEGHPVHEQAEEEASIQQPELESAEYLDDVEPAQLLIRLANRFRIYPRVNIDVSDAVGEVELVRGGKKGGRRGGRKGGKKNGGKKRGGRGRGRGRKGSSLAEGNATEGYYSYYSYYSESEEPDAGCDYNKCFYVRDCTEKYSDCGGCSGCPEESETTTTTTEEEVVETTTTTKRTTTTTTLPPEDAWRVDVEKVSVKAQAYVAHALANMGGEKATYYMKRWFGSSTATTKRKVNHVLNSLSGMLGNVAYMKGPECQPTTYAYVYPYGEWSKNEKGEYVFYLCSVYFKSKIGEKIETLTHEGSHHAVAYTDDVCGDDACSYTAYGRTACLKVAKSSPEKAIRNADNHCYFINDMNTKTYRR
mmetsp:Transcript_14174/g.33452  ORF Transcript_14174/g.33452 Transcript_14174/m.33452 type:complete len:572 (+) Transcript_14174:91-1806(+)|eukprot:CAMPEP_0178410470 /NCGR_PEP_ID=MMETSP0689_2-20121128/20995_1 /TAXON_ID=160604 /ORGANISM="Amphidinium massartii, Strain CS-259" /LENGTH=571 /DNA_ID=CAMNT_0020031645 /DNA_START=92 /DNA_END=1807 /DNA_ORIENTATION=-